MIVLTGNDLTLAQVIRCAEGEEKVVISKGATERVKSSRKKIEDYISSGAPIYGVITGIDTFDNSSLSHSSMIKAENNMKLLEVDSRVHFFEHDLSLPIRSKLKYDLVISSLVFHNLGIRRFAGYENVFAVLKRKGYFVIGDFFHNDKADTKFLTSFSELIEDVHGEGRGKWKYGIKILRKR